jgi:enamine deaminase RidA (YjgF/YER057c/UK114 family)
VEDVVRTRMFVADITHREDIGRVHKELFDAVRPVATMVQIAGFAHPDHLIEVEIDAYKSPLTPRSATVES